MRLGQGNFRHRREHRRCRPAGRACHLRHGLRPRGPERPGHRSERAPDAGGHQAALAGRLRQARRHHRERAEAFNSKQRSFWAAANLAGVPKPAAAGAKETTTVEGLSPGVHYFAVKSWDAADNISELSNVVEVTVK